MYNVILNGENTELGDTPLWFKTQENGVSILCNYDERQGVIIDGVSYYFLGGSNVLIDYNKSVACEKLTLKLLGADVNVTAEDIKSALGVKSDEITNVEAVISKFNEGAENNRGTYEN